MGLVLCKGEPSNTTNSSYNMKQGNRAMENHKVLYLDQNLQAREGTSCHS
jgi:hypothetical protein